MGRVEELIFRPFCPSDVPEIGALLKSFGLAKEQLAKFSDKYSVSECEKQVTGFVVVKNVAIVCFLGAIPYWIKSGEKLYKFGQFCDFYRLSSKEFGGIGMKLMNWLLSEYHKFEFDGFFAFSQPLVKRMMGAIGYKAVAKFTAFTWKSGFLDRPKIEAHLLGASYVRMRSLRHFKTGWIMHEPTSAFNYIHYNAAFIDYKNTLHPHFVYDHAYGQIGFIAEKKIRIGLINPFNTHVGYFRMISDFMEYVSKKGYKNIELQLMNVNEKDTNSLTQLGFKPQESWTVILKSFNPGLINQPFHFNFCDFDNY